MSLSNDEGEGNENRKNAIGWDWQNSNFARASRFFVHFFDVTARLKVMLHGTIRNDDF